MIEISLTEFVDFVIKSGTPKLTHVKRVKRDHIRGYDPKRDYYKKLRDGIVEMHENGRPKKDLDLIVRGLTDANKVNTYPVMIQAYKGFLGRKSLSWVNPPKNSWDFGDLSVRVNPELGLKDPSGTRFIKLYFKSDPLSKTRSDLVNFLMLTALARRLPGSEVGILDIRTKKLFSASVPDSSLAPLLEGEALSFTRMYKAT